MSRKKTKAQEETAKAVKPAMLMYPVEQAECPGCESVIRQEHVIRKLVDPRSLDVTKQNVRVWCERCNRGWVVERMLRNGVWEQIGDVRELTGSELAALTRRLDAQRGDVQVA